MQNVNHYFIFGSMISTTGKYNNKTAKLKRFSKKNLLHKIYPVKSRQHIPDNFLSKSGYTKDTLVKEIYRLIDCNCQVSYVKKRIKKAGKITREIKIFDTNHCNIYALCPICAEKISRRRREKYKDQIKSLAALHNHTYMITFTVRDEDNFNDAYEKLTFAIRKYVLMGQLRGADTNGKEKRSSGEAGKIKAMAVSKEIKIGAGSKRFHIHAHAIVFTDEQLDYRVYEPGKRTKITNNIFELYNRRPTSEELRPAVEKWYTIEVLDRETGELKDRLVPISKASMEWVKATNKTSSNIDIKPMEGDPESIYKQCLEVIKYTSKVSDFNREQILEILVNRKGKRFFSTYGSLYDVQKEETGETEQILENQGLDGYVWSKEKDKLIKMNKEEMAVVKFKFDNRDNLYKAKSKIMKGYHLKEAVKKKVIKEYEQRRRGDRSGLPEYKLMVIDSVNDLENAYTMYKRKTYKLYMNIQTTRRDTMDKPSPIQRHYLKEANLFIQEVAQP